MGTIQLKQQLRVYDKWKTDLISTIKEYQPWLTAQGMATPEGDRRIANCIDTLENDRLTIAFVAEFSRGKTELINAIFFADYGRRMLPSTPGRTTMCPTEIFYDRNIEAAYVRLLPIETRLQDTSLAEQKKDATKWVHTPLCLHDTKQIQDAMSQVVETKRVTVEEAGRLGIYDDELELGGATSLTHVEIPKWRHALISFPHPLLRQGLSILDTPGLNALGHEPELTLSMLPEAQAVLFVLAADTGVTRTDLQMWQHHIKGFQASRQRGLMVVLNKIDTLWDDLEEKSSIQRAIKRQLTSTAKILGISEQAIFPVSAQKGLLAKVRDNESLLAESALPLLEAYLSGNILSAKQEILQETTAADICHMMEDTRSLISAGLVQLKNEQDELKTLSGESADIIVQLLRKAQAEKIQYLNDVNRFKSNKSKLSSQAQALRRILDMKELDQRITKAHANMLSNWTTIGLRSEMQNLFADLSGRMQLVVKHCEQSRKLIRTAYSHFQHDHGFAAIQPKMFSIMEYRMELKKLFLEAEQFRNSPSTLISVKRFVVKRFFSTIIERARGIFVRASEDADSWLDTAFHPLMYQIRDHQDLLEQKLKDLRKISTSRGTLEKRILQLDEEQKARNQQLTALHNMHNILVNSRPITEKKHPHPRLVRSNTARH
ncbi:FIG00555615: hypothetical protein [hydrothermal vent metagenome]|uniref:Dynamin N-terminal domain-containing protein n=1 Tax=hydrothermal vent metagenome TaxID=652676 RepID=A0A3B1B841_9ZZZZ